VVSLCFTSLPTPGGVEVLIFLQEQGVVQTIFGPPGLLLYGILTAEGIWKWMEMGTPVYRTSNCSHLRGTMVILTIGFRETNMYDFENQ